MPAILDRKSAAANYIEAVGRKDFAAVEACLAPDVSFRGPFMQLNSAAEFVGALQRLAPILVRNDVRRVFAEGDAACIFYDFVTDTESGAVPTVEFLTFRDDKIAEIEILFDRMQFAAACDAVAKRSGR